VRAIPSFLRMDLPRVWGTRRGAHDILVSLHSNRASRRPVPISAREAAVFLPGPVLAAIRLSPSDTNAASLCTAIYYEFLLRLGKHRAYFKVVLHSPSLKTRVRGGESGSVFLDAANRSRGSVELR
jgi:hypothetical protein